MARTKRAARPSQQHPPANKDWKKWINSYPTVSSWVKQYDLEKLLDEHGGLVRIENFLPEFVANGILATLEGFPQSSWNETAAHEDYTHNNIDHAFWSTKQAKGLDTITRAFAQLLPGKFHSFSAARYDTTHRIAPHDDRAYTQVRTDEGQVLACSRSIAVIYYLTQDWQESFGGNLIDTETGKLYVPKFNSVVSFRIPRYHEVTPMKTDRPRFSIFGWFLEPGILYDLYRGEDDGIANGTRKAAGKANTSGKSQPEGSKKSKPGTLPLPFSKGTNGLHQQQQQPTPAPELESGPSLAAPAGAPALPDVDPSLRVFKVPRKAWRHIKKAQHAVRKMVLMAQLAGSARPDLERQVSKMQGELERMCARAHVGELL